MNADSSFNPYPGLRPFDDEHAEFFKGRDRHVDQIIRSLKGERFVSIVGVSGCGKSSLIYAGLIPKLHEGQLLPIRQRAWRVVVTTPYGTPWRRLSQALSEAGIQLGHAASETPDARPATALVNAVQRALHDADEGSPGKSEASGEAFALLLVVDQFEEIFHSHAGGVPPDAADFVRTLLLAAGQDTVPIYIVLAMRSDFTGDCARFRDLPEKIDRTQFLVPRMSREDMVAAIVEPAAEEGVAIEPDLVNRLIRDTGDDPDRLPLLQHALSRLWELSNLSPGTDSASITLGDYETVGHIPPAATLDASSAPDTTGKAAPFSALDRHAEFIFNPSSDSRDDDGKEQPRGRKQHIGRVFRFLTQRESGQRNTRVKKSLRDCARIVFAPTGAAADWSPTDDQVKELAAMLDPYRSPGCWFLRPYRNKVPALDADDLIDITHESLITGWSRLRKWVDREYQDAREYQWITRAAEKWSEGKGGYLSPEDLARFEEWRDRVRLNHPWAARYDGKLETVFAYAAAWREETDRQAKQKAREQARKRGWKIFGVFGACAAAFFFFQQLKKDRDAAIGETVNGYIETLERSSGEFDLSVYDALWRLAATPSREKAVRAKMLGKLYAAPKGNDRDAIPLELADLQRFETHVHRAAAGLGAVATDFRADQAPSLAAGLAAAITTSKKPARIEPLATALAALGKYLRQEDKRPVTDAAKSIVTLMKSSDDPETIVSLASSLAPLADHLPADKQMLADAADHIVTAMKSSDDPDYIRSLASSMAALVKHMPGDKQLVKEAADEIADEIATVIKDSGNSFTLRSLASSLAALGEHLPDDKHALTATANELATAIQGGSADTNYAIRPLALALAALGGHLPGDKQPLTTAANVITGMIKASEDPETVSSLGISLARIGEHLPSGHPALTTSADRILELMNQNNHPEVIQELVPPLMDLSKHLPSGNQVIDGAAIRILEIMGKVEEPWMIAKLAAALGELGERVPPERQALVIKAANKLLEQMNSGEFQETTESLAFFLSQLAMHLSYENGSMTALADRLTDQMTGSRDAPAAQRTLITTKEQQGGTEPTQAASNPLTDGMTATILTCPADWASMPEQLRAQTLLDLTRDIVRSQKNGSLPSSGKRFGECVLRWGNRERLMFAIDDLLWVTAYPQNSGEREGELGNLIAGIGVQELVEILKNPLCTGEAERVVLARLQEKLADNPKANFGGDIWKFIEQAPALGLDVKSPPARPNGEAILKALEEEFARPNPPLPKKDLKNP